MAPGGPPTDRELSERGLGFPPRLSPPPPIPSSPVAIRAPPIKTMTPPALVAREIGEHMARSAASTPQRELPPTPPSEVVVAVALSKAEQQRQYQQRHAPPPVGISIMDDGPSPRSRSPVPQPLQLHTQGAGAVIAGHNDGSLLHAGDDGSVRGSSADLAAVGSPPTSGNGYSLGASLPRGVQWRYVDVLNKQT